MASLRAMKIQRTRKRIIEEALRLFNKQGLAKTSITQIAEKAEIGTGTFYNYFESKEHLLGEVVRQESGKQLRRVQNEPVSDNPKEAILQIARALMSFKFKRSLLTEIYSTIFDNWRGLKNMRPEIPMKDLIDDDMKTLEIIQNIFNRGREAGKIRKNLDVSLASLTIYSCFIQCVIGYIVGYFPNKQATLKMFDAMVSMIFEGLV